MRERTSHIKRHVGIALLAALVAFGATSALPASSPSVARAEVVDDVGASIFIDSMAMPNPPEVDKDRCLAVALLEWQDVPGAKSYEFVLSDTLNFWDQPGRSPIVVSAPFEDDDFQFAWYTRTVPDGHHQMFLSSFSTGQGCGPAEAAFAGRFEILSQKANVGAPVAAFTYTIDENDPLYVHFDASGSTGDPPLSYDWVWDAEGTSGGYERDDPTPDKTYFEPGTYRVTLTVTDSPSLDTDDVTHDVVVKDGGWLRGGLDVPDGTSAQGITISYTGAELGSVLTGEFGGYSKFVGLGSYIVNGPDGFCYTLNTSECQTAVPVSITRVGDQVIVEPETVDFATENLSPEAVIKFTKHQDDPFTFSFDGSDSTDPDDDIETWEWNFGDGQSATGATPPPHTFADGTERTITLRVTDKTGLRDSTEIKIRPGKFKVSGQFYERVCGRPSTLAPFQAPELVHVKADSPDGFLEMRPDADGYEFESTPGDFTVFPTEVLVRQRATPPFPEWDPAVRFFPLESDVPDQDFELCYAPSAPVQANILSRNGVFKADTLSVRNGGIIRICDEDGISRVISAFGKAGGDDIYSYGTDRYTETTASGCMSIVPVNSAPSVMHLDLLSQSFLGTIFITVVVLPGAPPSGITTLVSPANAGSNRLEVASNSGFVPGDQVLLDPDGTGKATYTMQQNGSIILTQPLKRSYPAGTIVVNLTNPPPGFSLEQPQVNSGGVPGQDPNQFPVLGGTVVPATPAAAATPVSEVSGARSISPPSTGTGGLADDSQGNRWRVVVLVAAMLVPALAVWRRPQRGRRAPPLSQAPPCA